MRIFLLLFSIAILISISVPAQNIFGMKAGIGLHNNHIGVTVPSQIGLVLISQPEDRRNNIMLDVSVLLLPWQTRGTMGNNEIPPEDEGMGYKPALEIALGAGSMISTERYTHAWGLKFIFGSLRGETFSMNGNERIFVGGGMYFLLETDNRFYAFGASMRRMKQITIDIKSEIDDWRYPVMISFTYFFNWKIERQGSRFFQN